MPENAVIGQFERRLVELGCPVARARRKARELGDHLADLQQAALEDGLPESAAEAKAVTQLGEPALLAEALVRTMRQSSWWGRHPILGFCILPLFGFIPAWVVCGWLLVGVVWLAGHLAGPAYTVTRETAHALALDPAGFGQYAHPVNYLLNGAASALIAALFCFLARRAACGPKWIALAGAICSLGCAFSRTEIMPGSIVVGWVSKPNWSGVAVPWVVALLVFARYWRALRRLPISAVSACSGVVGAQFGPMSPGDSGQKWSATFLATPTYWVSTPMLLGLVGLAGALLHGLGVAHLELVQTPARLEKLRRETWPAESAATVAQVKSRETTVNTNQQTLDLLPWVNVSPNDSAVPSGDPSEIALLDFPLGAHIFGGTLFDVSGKIQLMGRALLKENRLYPVLRQGIPVRQKCKRLCLLHGASHVIEPGVTVAKLKLHFADGSVAELPIVAGEQVMNSWGPLYTTPLADEPLAPTAPGTQLAWVGGRAVSGDQPSWMAVRVYQTAFTNPQPEVELTSLDYVSALSEAAPFLLAITIEK